MAAPALEIVLRRERWVVSAALVVLTGLAWAYLLLVPNDTVMSGAYAMTPRPWGIGEFVALFAMWAVMMVGMMLPSAAPTILLHARVARQAAARGNVLAATGFFVAGYLSAWALFSIAATLAQWTLERALVVTPMMTSASVPLSAALLVVAGAYQWTAAKDACLAHCRAPLAFIEHHGGFGRTPGHAVDVGFRHGLYCIGCCWALMALLFVGGVMNLLWVALLAGVVLVEKLLPARMRWPSRLLGGALVLGGVLLMTVATG